MPLREMCSIIFERPMCERQNYYPRAIFAGGTHRKVSVQATWAKQKANPYFFSFSCFIHPIPCPHPSADEKKQTSVPMSRRGTTLRAPWSWPASCLRKPRLPHFVCPHFLRKTCYDVSIEGSRGKVNFSRIDFTSFELRSFWV